MSEIEVTKVGDGVALMTLTAPERKNALTVAMADEMVAALEELDHDDSIGALVIRGGGGTFCSGAHLGDLDSFMTDPAGHEAYTSLERIYRAFTRVGELRTATIAAVRGAAVGAGVNLAMAAMVRIVADDARIISGFTRIGLHPGGGHLQLLARAAGAEAAAAMGIFSDEVSGTRAVDVGLAWRSLPDAEVEDHALKMAAKAARDPELTRRAVQSLKITAIPSVPWATAVQAERAPQMWSLRRTGQRKAE